MTWEEFGFLAALLGMWGYAEWWKDKARRIDKERRIYRRMAHGRIKKIAHDETGTHIRIASEVFDQDGERWTP